MEDCAEQKFGYNIAMEHMRDEGIFGVEILAQRRSHYGLFE